MLNEMIEMNMQYHLEGHSYREKFNSKIPNQKIDDRYVTN